VTEDVLSPEVAARFFAPLKMEEVKPRKRAEKKPKNPAREANIDFELESDLKVALWYKLELLSIHAGRSPQLTMGERRHLRRLGFITIIRSSEEPRVEYRLTAKAVKILGLEAEA